MHNYYNIIRQELAESTATFVVELRADCPVYEGHFPGNPIAPGACNIEMVRQCASLALGHEVRIAAIRMCKFMMLIRPGEPQYLTIEISWHDGKMDATIVAEGKPAVQLKMNIV